MLDQAIDITILCAMALTGGMILVGVAAVLWAVLDDLAQRN